jgi:O-antigen/teichoic acid export membrane protein
VSTGPRPAPHSRMRQLAAHSFVYGLAGVLTKLVGIILLPVYAHYVTPAEFGEIELVLVTVTLAAIVLRLGLLAGMFRFVFDFEPDARRSTIQTVFTSILGLSTFGLLVGLALVGPIADVMEVPRELVLIGLFGLWVTMNYDVIGGVYRIEQRPLPYVSFSLVNLALTVVFSLLFVIVLDLGGEGILLGNFSGSFVVYGAMLVARRDVLGFHSFDRHLLRRILNFSIPLMPAGISLWALNAADRFQVQRLASDTDLGIYSAASKIALGIMVLIGAFQTAWVPFANSIADDDDARRTYRLAFSYWSVWTVWGLVAISALAPLYIHLTMPSDWWDSSDLVPLLMAGSVLWGAYMIINIGVNRSKRTRLTPVVTATAAAVNIGLNFLLIPAWGVVGAAVSTVVGYSVLVLLGWLNAQTGFPVPYDWARVARIAVAAAGLVALSVWVIPDTGVAAWIGRILLVAVYPLALVVVGAVRPNDWRRFERLIDRVRQGRRKRAAESGFESAL